MTDSCNPALDQLVTALRGSGLDFAGEPNKVRADFEATLATIPVAPDLGFGETMLGGIPALSISPPGPLDDGVLLYLHGGAFIAGSAFGYRGLAGELCRAAGLEGRSIDYRLAPEHPFPAALEDALAAYRALLDAGYAPGDIIVAGDSAGGGLMVSLLVALREAGLEQPRAALAISPWVDMGCDAASYADKAGDDPSLTVSGLRQAAAHYLGGRSERHGPGSPVRSDLGGLAPLLIQVGSNEILLDDAVSLARAAGAAKVQVRLEIWPAMVHVWHAFGFMLAEGREAIAVAGTFLKDARR